MAPYFEHMNRKSTHERRQHAMRVAGVVTALIFAGWLSTLGLRAATGGSAAVAGSADDTAQTAAALTAQAGSMPGSAQGNQLVVASSTN